jgi:hypothetical protein
VYVRAIVTVAERLREHDSPFARGLVAVLACLLLVAGLWSLARWVTPDDTLTGSVIVRSCFDADELHDAGLLDDARGAYRAIETAHGKGRCPPLDRSIASAVTEAALEREKGAEYLHAARLRRGTALERGRHIAEIRAREAFTRSLAIDPYHEETRRDLNGLLGQLGGPTDRASADDRCELGGRLRAAGLLPEAATLYTQSLRAARHSTCTRQGLRLTRDDMAKAQEALLEAKSLTAAGRREAARHKYLEALTINSALVDARAALPAHPGIDPREGTFWGRPQLMGEDAVAWLGGAVNLLADHAAALVLAGIALCLLLLLLMVVLMFVTRAKFVRGGLDKRPLRWLPLRRFTHARILIAAFTPEEKASGAGAIFAHYLTMAPILQNAPLALGADGSEIPQDLIESPEAPRDPLEDAATLLAGIPQAAALAAVVQFLVNSAPRWEARLTGQVLDPDARGHGLRVLVTARRGRTSGTFTVWASDLPGPQLPDQPEAAARYALAIKAAAWAHDAINR